MYEKLIKSLRVEPFEVESIGLARTMNEAADAIEELSKRVPPVPHGRLIDADALNVIGYCGIPQGSEDTFDDGVMWLAKQIDLLPTIIEAEEGRHE